MASFKNKVEQNPVIATLVMVFVGFTSGIGVYQGILEITQLDVVRRGTYVYKSDVVGNLLRKEALTEIKHLAELGEKIDFNAQPGQGEAYMLKVHTFVHYLDLPKEIEIAGDKYSFAEKQVDHIIRDIPNTGQAAAPLDQKIMRIVGVLKGIQASLSALQQ